jgi:uncharacterized protein (TIGR02246 family)
MESELGAEHAASRRSRRLRGLRDIAQARWLIIRSLVAHVILLAWMTAVAAAQLSPAAGAVVEAFVHAWNTHDGPALGRLYADDADWVMVGGGRLKGRNAIEAALAREHAGWARITTLRATDVVVRELDRERAIVMFKWEITSDAERAARPFRGNTVLVVAKARDGWVIVAGQAAAVPASK